MSGRDVLSSHWTDDQLIAYLYGVSTEDEHAPGHSHVNECEECRRRMEAMQATRAALQRDHCVETDLHADLLATQRRAVYARIDSSAGWISKFPIRRWVITACGVVMVSTGAWVWEHSTNLKQPGILEIQRARLSDEQLVYEASEVAERAEPKAAAPIQALFEN